MSQDELIRLPEKRAGWWRVLVFGLLAYFVGIFVLIVTSNPVLFPTVVMIGCFTIPVAYVAFFYERRHLSLLTMPTTAKSFLYGGVLGVFASALLEPLLVHDLNNLFSFFLIGLIEEFAKILGVLSIARRTPHDQEIDGIILGAGAGMGFASFESSGYAFTAFLGSQGSLSITVLLMLLRGFFSPFGHGTWTAILTGVLFRESAAGRFRLSRKVLGTYFLVSILHGLWDGIPVIISVFLHPGVNILIGYLIVGSIGFFILWRHWRRAVRSNPY
jgi:RsiW-degrading membrane proteinase PrsW (M82 family)